MNHIFSIIIFLLIMTVDSSIMAQQQLPSSNHPDDLYLGNPAARNSWYYLFGDPPPLVFNLHYRNQWQTSQVEGTPWSAGASLESVVGTNKNHLVSLEGRIAQWGSLESYYFKGRYAINLNGAFGGDGRKYSFNLGTAVHWESLQLDLEKISFNNPNDQVIFSDNSTERGSYPRISLGFFGHISKKLLYGIAISQWFAVKERIQGAVSFYQHPQVLGNISYIATLWNDNTYLELAGAASYVENTPINYSFMFRPHHLLDGNRNMVSFGLGYVKNSFQVEFNWINAERFRFGCSMDLISFGTYSSTFNNFSTFDIKTSIFLQ